MDEQPATPNAETPATPPAPAPPRKLTALEARKKYGIRAVIFLALFCWFGYDAWINTDLKMQEHHLFNASGGYIFALLLLYNGVMASSATFTVLRQQKQSPPPPPSATPK